MTVGPATSPSDDQDHNGLAVKSASTRRRILWGWAAIGLCLTAASVALAWVSPAFDAAVPYADKPAIGLALALAGSGAVFALLRPLLQRTQTAGLADDRRLMIAIVVFGAAMRLTQLHSLPAMEDDWYRYLWDGAVTAHGFNPYSVSPDDAQSDAYEPTLQPLAHQSGVVIERINHPDLRTIYPPLAQAAFALAYVMKPWGLDAWRLVNFAAEAAALAVLLLILKRQSRPSAWAAVYWWNPLAVKELANSAHMDALLLPVVLGALLLAISEHRSAAAAVLAVAAGIKIWPIILIPLVLRPVWADPARLGRALLVPAVVLAALAAPVIAAGLDDTSGLLAYATRWQTNSAIFPVVANLFQSAVGAGGAQVARGLFAATLILAIVMIARPPLDGPTDELQRAALIITALILLSPAQFPWYLVWVLPLAALFPWRGVFAATALLPLYYASFHFLARDTYPIYRDGLIWLVWLPIYLAYWLDVRAARRTPGPAHA